MIIFSFSLTIMHSSTVLQDLGFRVVSRSFSIVAIGCVPLGESCCVKVIASYLENVCKVS